MRRWISCVRPPTLPRADSRGMRGRARAGQHAVLGRDPAAAAVAQEGRHALFDAGGADHAGLPDLDQHRAVGVRMNARGDLDRPQLRQGFGRRYVVMPPLMRRS